MTTRSRTPRIGARLITRQTKWYGWALKTLCDELGIAQTIQGRDREVDLSTLMLVVLISELIHDFGLVRAEAISMACEVKPEIWRQIFRYDQSMWLYARPDPTGQAKWIVTIAENDEQALDLMNALVADKETAALALSLRALCRRVRRQEKKALEDVVEYELKQEGKTPRQFA
jgi:hypothetical protein